MIYIVDNLLAIAVATLAGLAFGVVWIGLAGPRVLRSPGFVATVAAAEFWLCAILAGALILAPPKADAWVMAIGTAAIIWIGFVVPVLAVTLRARGVGSAGVVRDCGHWLGVMLVQTIVLESIGLAPPPV